MSIEEKKKLQIKYCRENGHPHFAPRNGICFKCNKQIYNKISEEKVANELITSCPHCMRSFRD
jgi:uncharacterized protein with PIN domain